MRSKLALAVSGIFLVMGSAAAEPARVVSPEFLATIKDDDALTLPRGFSAAERAAWQSPQNLPAPTVAPNGFVRASAEYERNEGLLIRWGSQNSVLTQLTVAATTGDPDALVHIVVASTSLRTSATTTLTNAGADMTQVRFIIAPSDSVWMRDYGPRFINNNGSRGIVDHPYNRPRPNDDSVPDSISTQWVEPQFDIPLIHGGGNFHLFRNREAFMTTLIQNENPGLSAQQITDYYAAYQGLDVTIYPAFPTSFDSTQHIDMWMLPVADDRVIISQYAASTGTPKTITDNAAADLTGRGYTVFRTPGWQGSNGAHYTYANAVVLNQQVLLCQFNGYATENAQARSVFQSAFPTHSIVNIDCSSIITLAGAIHCIVMHVPEMDEIFENRFDD